MIGLFFGSVVAFAEWHGEEVRQVPAGLCWCSTAGKHPTLLEGDWSTIDPCQDCDTDLLVPICLPLRISL